MGKIKKGLAYSSDTNKISELEGFDYKLLNFPLLLAFHVAVCHCETQNNFVIRSKNGKEIIQYGLF